MNKDLFKSLPNFKLIGNEQDSSSPHYFLVKNLLENLFESLSFDLADPDDREAWFKKMMNALPMIARRQSFGKYSIFSLSKYRKNSFQFVYQMISRWLIPQDLIEVHSVTAYDFSFLSRFEKLTVTEIFFTVKSQEGHELIEKYFPSVESQLQIGLHSRFHAERILEVKGLYNDQKTALIQESISSLIHRMPHQFDSGVFSEMQHILIASKSDFKAARSVRHLTRIICLRYLFREGFKERMSEKSEQRILFLKIFRAKIESEKGKTPVLALIVGVNFLQEKEVFEQAHLLKAIANYLPGIVPVKGSVDLIRRGAEPYCILYLEVEKKNGELFSLEEVKTLSDELPSDLEGRIEHMMHPVFMPRNEEEVLRNILTLGDQLKFLRDIPQVYITFEEQNYHSLFFTIILVRIAQEGDKTIEQIFLESETLLKYSHDQCKTIGYVRKKYVKEATVFRVQIPKEHFLRRDHSIDLYKARQMVVRELQEIIGEFRDYNGGMISKQNELLTALRSSLLNATKHNELLLENFFYSLHPVIMRTVLSAAILKKLFLMVVDSINHGFFYGERHSVSIRSEPNELFVVVAIKDKERVKQVVQAVKELNIQSMTLASTRVSQYQTIYLGYLYRTDNPQNQREFIQAVQFALEGEPEVHLTE